MGEAKLRRNTPPRMASRKNFLEVIFMGDPFDFRAEFRPEINSSRLNFLVCNDSGNGPGTARNAPLINTDDTDRRTQERKLTAEQHDGGKLQSLRFPGSSPCCAGFLGVRPLAGIECL